tara:strand:- start:4740 stop:5675 length:936 start_codon:yes stop_codon:yes gene_type:complete
MIWVLFALFGIYFIYAYRKYAHVFPQLSIRRIQYKLNRMYRAASRTETPEQTTAMVEYYLKKGMYFKANEHLKQIISQYPEAREDVFYYLGVIYEKSHLYDEAKLYFRRALVRSKDSKARFRLCCLLVRQNNWDEVYHVAKHSLTDRKLQLMYFHACLNRDGEVGSLLDSIFNFHPMHPRFKSHNLKASIQHWPIQVSATNEVSDDLVAHLCEKPSVYRIKQLLSYINSEPALLYGHLKGTDIPWLVADSVNELIKCAGILSGLLAAEDPLVCSCCGATVEMYQPVCVRCGAVDCWEERAIVGNHLVKELM